MCLGCWCHTGTPKLGGSTILPAPPQPNPRSLQSSATSAPPRLLHTCGEPDVTRAPIPGKPASIPAFASAGSPGPRALPLLLWLWRSSPPCWSHICVPSHRTGSCHISCAGSVQPPCQAGARGPGQEPWAPSTHSFPFILGSNRVREAGKARGALRHCISPLIHGSRRGRDKQQRGTPGAWGGGETALKPGHRHRGWVHSSRQAAADQEIPFLGTSLTSTPRRTSGAAAGVPWWPQAFVTSTTVRAERVLSQQPGWMRPALLTPQSKPTSLPRSSADFGTPRGHPARAALPAPSAGHFTPALQPLYTFGQPPSPFPGIPLSSTSPPALHHPEPHITHHGQEGEERFRGALGGPRGRSRARTPRLPRTCSCALHTLELPSVSPSGCTHSSEGPSWGHRQSHRKMLSLWWKLYQV